MKPIKIFLSSGGVNMKTYDPRSHVALIENIKGREFASLKESLDEFLSDTRGYIFSDVIPFLKKIGKENSFVASHGDMDFQFIKIRSTKIDELVADVKISVNPKWQAIYEVARVGKVNLEEMKFILLTIKRYTLMR